VAALVHPPDPASTTAHYERSVSNSARQSANSVSQPSRGPLRAIQIFRQGGADALGDGAVDLAVAAACVQGGACLGGVHAVEDGDDAGCRVDGDAEPVPVDCQGGHGGVGFGAARRVWWGAWCKGD
jgi:hypothetical protein